MYLLLLGSDMQQLLQWPWVVAAWSNQFQIACLQCAVVLADPPAVLMLLLLLLQQWPTASVVATGRPAGMSATVAARLCRLRTRRCCTNSMLLCNLPLQPALLLLLLHSPQQLLHVRLQLPHFPFVAFLCYCQHSLASCRFLLQ